MTDSPDRLLTDIHCGICGKHMTEQGGLLFSPPDTNGLVKKTHLCTKCYKLKEGYQKGYEAGFHDGQAAETNLLAF